MADISDAKQHLEQIGLEEREARVYLALANTGVTSVTRLSKRLGIPRTTIYRVCESLNRKKFVEWVIQRQGKKVKAVVPQKLDIVIKQKKEELRSVENALEKLKQLNLGPKNKCKQTEVRYYHGLEGGKQLVWNTLKAHHNIYGYTCFDRIKVFGLTFDQEYNLEATKRNLADHVILNPKGVKRLTVAQSIENIPSVCDIRVKDIFLSGDIYIYNNIYAVNFWDETQMFGLEIENNELVKVQVAIFRDIWGTAIPIEKYRG